MSFLGLSRTSRIRSSFVVAVLLALPALLAVTNGQEQSPAKDVRLSERAGVALRLVDVVVTHKDGRPMTGLGRDDFLVKIDGKERKIRSLDSASSVPTVEPIVLPDGTVVNRRELPERPDRWVVIFLDAVRIPPNYRNIVVETARSIVENSGSDGDRFAVALLNRGELRYLHEFAPRHEFNLAVFDDPDVLLTTADDMRHRLDEMTELVKGCKGLNTQDSCIITRTEEFVGLLRSEAFAGIQAMRSLVSAMSPLPGRKAMIWFTNGMVLQPGEVVLDAVTRYVGEPSAIISHLEDRGDGGLELMLAEATRAGVSVFGLRAGSDSGADMRGAQHAGVDRQLAGHAGNPYKLATTLGQESMRDSADATGGKVIFTPLGYRVGFGLLDRLDGVYTLGIAVEPQDSRRSKVKVRLRSKKGKIQAQGRMTHRFPPTLPLAARLTLDDATGVTLNLDLENLASEKIDKHSPPHSRIAIYGHVRTADGLIEAPYYRIVEIVRADDSPGTFEQQVAFPAPAGKHMIELFVSDLIGGAQTAVSALRGESDGLDGASADAGGARP